MAAIDPGLFHSAFVVKETIANLDAGEVVGEEELKRAVDEAFFVANELWAALWAERHGKVDVDALLAEAMGEAPPSGLLVVRELPK